MKLHFIRNMTTPRFGKDHRQFTLQIDYDFEDDPKKPLLLKDIIIDAGTHDSTDGPVSPVKYHTYCEYLSKETDNRVTKPFFDRDQYFDAEPSPEQTQAAHQEVVRRIHQIIHAINNVIAPKVAGVNITFKIATRHGWTPDGRYKLSFRPFLSGVRIKYTDIPMLLNHKSINQLKDGFWDTSVYKESEQLLATIYGRKNNKDTRVLLPEEADNATTIDIANVNVSEYLVQVAPPNWLLLGTYMLQANQAPGGIDGANNNNNAKKTGNKAATKSKGIKNNQYADDNDGSSGFDKIDDLAEVQHLTIPLSKDAGLHEFFDNRDFNGLRFQYAHKSPDGQVMSLYIQHAAHQMCPIAGRVHKSNNATIIVNLKKRRVTFRCFDEDCQQGAGTDTRNNMVDITAHLQPATMDAIFAAPSASDQDAQDNNNNINIDIDNNEVSFIIDSSDDDNDDCRQVSKEDDEDATTFDHQPQTPLIKALTDIIRKSKEFADVPKDCKLVLFQPKVQQEQPTAGQGGGVTRLSVHFRMGDKTGVLTQNTSVFDCSGNFIDMLIKDQLVPGPLSYIEPTLPADASFAFNQISAKDGQLKSLEPHAGYSLTLYNMFDEQRNTVALQVPRKAAKNITQRAKVKELMNLVQEASTAHVSRVLGDQFVPVVFNVQNNSNQLINNGTINIATPSPDDGFPVLRDKIDNHAQEHRLRKLDGYIYEPLPHAPCAYVKKWTYKKYLNTILRHDPAYRSIPRRHHEAVDYLESYDTDFLPVLEPDRDLLSFANGVLVLSTRKFLEHNDPTLQGRVARHHIDQEYTGSTDTPLLDIVLDTQFDREVADILCGMLGRLFFNVGQLDNWQVMPYLVGIRGTGKSLILGIVDRFFHEEAVGYIAQKGVGLHCLADKEVIIGRDIPENLSKTLKQAHMQSMTSGERLSVPVKGMKAKAVRWSAPVIMASNHEPDYNNSGGQVSRRMVMFRFEHAVTNTREDLLPDILDHELPAIIARCLASYQRLLERVQEAGSFWVAMPVTIQNWRNRMCAATCQLPGVGRPRRPQVRN